MSSVAGVIDNIDGNLLTGWVRDHPVSQVGLWRDGVQVATAEIWDRPFPENMRNTCTGLRIRLPDTVETSSVFDGTSQVLVETGEGALRVPIWPPVALTALVKALRPDDVEIALGRLTLQERAKIGLSAVQPDEGTGAIPAIGTISSDSAARVGRDGMLLLHAGSNELDALYRDAREEIPEAAAWGELVARRRQKARELGVTLVQALMPEKNSVASVFDPERDQVPTPLYSQTAAQLSVHEAGYVFVDWMPGFLHMMSPEAAFRRKDTHLTTAGAVNAMARFYRLLTRTQFPLRPQLPLRPASLESDLGGRFSGQYEEVVYLADAAVAVDGGVPVEPELIASSAPRYGYVGRSMHWRCPEAPDKRRVLVFGNSFFATGENSTQLSYWAARVFAETRFQWAADVDWDLVESFKPDILICQTIERFLAQVPET
ncbi:hypothetical protein [Poseidonocella sp. HB161398]|uniref:alginate O-acetyltransferase AlgX-related protein n=1 Tax=Poseidonocella sp. HB161398 TaxID=2320855 RepID=UPI0011092147|nr:hypothetical protein [Poseidonocella sp. HB161398]